MSQTITCLPSQVFTQWLTFVNGRPSRHLQRRQRGDLHPIILFSRSVYTSSPATGTTMKLSISGIIAQNGEKSTENRSESHNNSPVFLVMFYTKTNIPNRKSFSGTQANSRPHFSASRLWWKILPSGALLFKFFTYLHKDFWKIYPPTGLVAGGGMRYNST